MDPEGYWEVLWDIEEEILSAAAGKQAAPPQAWPQIPLPGGWQILFKSIFEDGNESAPVAIPLFPAA